MVDLPLELTPPTFKFQEMNQGLIQETTVTVEQPKPRQWMFTDENNKVILAIHLDDEDKLHLECAIGAFASVLMKGKADG